MNHNEPDLQSVLDSVFASGEKLTFEKVRAWQKRFPQFKREIAEAATDRREFEFLALEAETEELLPLSATAENALQRALEISRLKSAAEEEIADLRELTVKKGVARETLLKTLRVSETLLRKLERRNLKEIPAAIETKIAEILEIAPARLRNFFALPAMLPNTARYKSKNTPQTLPKQSFAEAVRHDPELNDEEKRELFELISNEQS